MNPSILWLPHHLFNFDAGRFESLGEYKQKVRDANLVYVFTHEGYYIVKCTFVPYIPGAPLTEKEFDNLKEQCKVWEEKQFKELFITRHIPRQEVSKTQVNAAGLYLEYLGVRDPFKAVPTIHCTKLQAILTKPKQISCLKSLLGTLALSIEVIRSRMQDMHSVNTNSFPLTVKAVQVASLSPSWKTVI